MINFKVTFPKIIIIFLIATVLFSSCIQQQSTRKKINLNDKWVFFYPETGNWYEAEVPGNIHTDLMKHGLISDPFYDTNSGEMSWIADETWRYRRDFTISNEFYERNLEIVFEGLDTYTDIFLNGKKIGETENMHKKWVFSIADSLKQKENRLEVVIYPSKKINAEKFAEAGIAIPDNRVFTRKAQYQYGWDWAPDFETSGIFKDVYLNSWVKLRMTDVNIEAELITDTVAFMVANIELESENYYNGDIHIISPHNEFDTLYQKLEIFEGKHTYQVEFPVKNPRLWWCNGLGEQKLYDVKIQVGTKFRIEEKNVKIGIRNIEFHSDKDSTGQNFYFILNGIPVFAKGANWIPADYFNGRNSYSNYKQLLELAKDANFNMLRVWGGGIYENDEFYNICDSLGIMIWQDFMFACAMYPADEKFSGNVEEEVAYQVNRLFNHPSVVLWCGNNEVSNGWFDWGWQKQFDLTYQDSLKIWNDYIKIFRQIIPNTIAKYDKKRKYIDSSPTYGWGHKESCTHGDSHYWGVWWGMEDFDMYYNKTGRFMSEYGFQGFPQISSLKKFIPEDSLFLYSTSLKTHQKHPIGFETIREYMGRNYFIPDNFDEYVYTSQVLQAEGVQKAFDAHLSAMPYCMGTLFWQFNDCWPVISWSAVDYYKIPKALYYFAKNSFKDIHISVIDKKEEKPEFFITNHRTKDIDGTVILKQIDFFGKVIFTDTIQMIIPKSKAVEVHFSDYLKSIFTRDSYKVFGVLELVDNSSMLPLAQRSFTISENKQLVLPEAEPQITTHKKDNYWEININSNVFIKNLYLYDNDSEGIFSDNYFNVLPGQTKTITYKPKNKVENLNLSYLSINQINYQRLGILFNILK
ncbi:MAG: hypothetical protein LBQ22_10055 [Bacteroidales bacterium]|jgi:beta-mannosidase|nr:hypothetical protein [Bacteroidales bacterium]